MGVQIFFVVLYYLLSLVYPGEVLIGFLIVHCIINIVFSLRKSMKSLNLFVFYSLGVAITSLANILFIIKVKTVGTGEDVLHIYNFIDMRYIDEGSLLWVVGNSFIFIGYQIFNKLTLPSIAIEINNKKSVDNIFYLMIGFTVLFYAGYNINLGFIAGGLQKIVLLLFSVGVLFFSRLWAAENNKKYGIYAAILCIIQTITALYNSYVRLEVISPLGIFILGYFIGKGEVKYLLSYRIVPAILVFAIFFQFFQELGVHRSHFIDAFVNTETANSRFTYAQEDENKGGTLMERFSCIAQLTNIIRLTKEKGFYNGTASLPLISALIPRFIWPDKPKIELGAWFAIEIGAGTISDFTGRSNNSVNMTIPGELYLDFNWFGVAIGCMFWGCLLAVFWNSTHFNDSPYNLTGVLWGGYLIQAAMGAFADMQIIISLTSTYLVFLMIRKITYTYENTRRGTIVEGQ